VPLVHVHQDELLVPVAQVVSQSPEWIRGGCLEQRVVLGCPDAYWEERRDRLLPVVAFPCPAGLVLAVQAAPPVPVGPVW
jgi:hypothetical protein